MIQLQNYVIYTATLLHNDNMTSYSTIPISSTSLKGCISMSHAKSLDQLASPLQGYQTSIQTGRFFHRNLAGLFFGIEITHNDSLNCLDSYLNGSKPFMPNYLGQLSRYPIHTHPFTAIPLTSQVPLGHLRIYPDYFPSIKNRMIAPLYHHVGCLNPHD